MPPESAIQAAQASALHRWRHPFAGFASGHDPRTGDNALLTLLYGGLLHAADHEWLNAGRRLIDKTYIDMLWQVQALDSMRSCRLEQVSASLDTFIQGTLRQHWASLWTLEHAEKQALTDAWVTQIAGSCFGSLYSEPAASRLLFHLCPMLPVHNFSRGHLMALEQLGHRPVDESYISFAASAQVLYEALSASLVSRPKPIAYFGTPAQQVPVQRLLDETDWWPRRLFDELLRGQCAGTPEARQRLLGCDDAGRLVPPE